MWTMTLRRFVMKPSWAGQARSVSPNALEERIAEDAVVLRRSVERANARVERGWIDDLRLDRRRAHSLNHRGEGSPRETIHQVRTARVDVDHARRDTNVREARARQQRIHLPTDQGISSGATLQFHLAVDRLLSHVAARVEERR